MGLTGGMSLLVFSFGVVYCVIFSSVDTAISDGMKPQAPNTPRPKSRSPSTTASATIAAW